MYITPERAIDVVMAACALHNYLRTMLPRFTNNLLDYEDRNTHTIIPGAWRNEAQLEDVQPLRGNTSTACAKRQRELLCEYVNGQGKVPWQDEIFLE